MRDSDIRKVLLNALAAEHANASDALIVEEMGIWSGSVRIDVAVINGNISGYEIKSNKDTLERLPFQIELYGKVFDNVNLVVGDRHLDRACNIIPKWWGVISAQESDDGVYLLRRRACRQNKKKDPYLIAQLLWRQEALTILERLGLSRGFRSKRVREIHTHLAANLTVEQLAAEVRVALKARNGWLG